MKQRRYPIALTIAGSDSGGGAGIQADLKTFSALGVYGTSAITAITAQNTLGVSAISSVPPEIVDAQLTALFSDFPIHALKTGMLYAPETVQVVTEAIRRWKPAHVVVDPVMIATSGDSLILEESIRLYKSRLFPLTDLLTPNCDEAALLTGLAVDSPDKMLKAAESLLATGCRGVLIKGGHLAASSNEATDLLLLADASPLYLTAPFIATRNTHGTGCTLSAAITAYLACGHPLADAVVAAKEYLTKALQTGAEANCWQGHGPLNHFHNPQPLCTF